MDVTNTTHLTVKHKQSKVLIHGQHLHMKQGRLVLVYIYSILACTEKKKTLYF